MSIIFECSGCGKPLSAKNDYAGKQGKCKCGTALIVPGNIERMKFSCPHCYNGISVSPRHIGKKGKCPTCNRKITIPHMAKLITSEASIVPLRRPKPAQTISAAASLAATAVSPAASFAPALIPASKSRPELIIDIIDAACQACGTIFKVKQQASAKMHECPACGVFVQVPGTEPQIMSNTSSTSRAKENRIYRIYWIVSFTALIGPLSYLAAYVLCYLIMDGTALPSSPNIMSFQELSIRTFALIVSPLAIALVLFMKFRYNIESVWTLNAAIFCYTVYLYNIIRNHLFFQ